MSNLKCIVTLNIGREFHSRWEMWCQRSWQQYAARHGYDIVSLENVLDTSDRAASRSMAWQKLLILHQAFSDKYERIVWIDSDIVIHPDAPDICESVPIKKVGAVDEYASPSKELYPVILQWLYDYWTAMKIPFIRSDRAEDWYLHRGYPNGFAQVVQAGVLVCSPTHHREIFLKCYSNYEQHGTAEWLAEMAPLSFELLNADLVHWIDPRFNWLWFHQKVLRYPFLFADPQHPLGPECVKRAFQSAYFLHFADAHSEVEWLGTDDPPVYPGGETPGRHSNIAGNTPVALFIYKRPDTTKLILNSLREAKVSRLFVIADGPGSELEKRACQITRELVSHPDWTCEVITNFSDHNLGIRRRIDSGLAWLFERVEEAIILEDDCVPDPCFFAFCSELLARYRNTDEVASIGGSDFTLQSSRHPDWDYFFSRYHLIWGWATWRRAWRLYAPDMTDWLKVRDTNWLERQMGDPLAAQYWRFIFESNFKSKENWDYAWILSCWLRGAKGIHPNLNLVSNYGFRSDASHATAIPSRVTQLPHFCLEFPLRHPASFDVDRNRDSIIEANAFSGTLARVFQRMRNKKVME